MYAPTRHYGYDNMKGILVFLVVFGHFLELCPATLQKNILYLVIYSFHMPAFLFFSGFFAKYHPAAWDSWQSYTEYFSFSTASSPTLLCSPAVHLSLAVSYSPHTGCCGTSRSC